MLAKRRVLVLLSSAGGGDRQPVLALAVALHEQGHEVLVSCDSATARMVSESGIPMSVHEVAQVGYISAWATQLDGDEPPANPLMAWAEDSIGATLQAAVAFSPDVIVSSLFTMGLAVLLSEALQVRWCFVNPSFYFGEESARDWSDDWHGSIVPRLARDCFDPLVGSADLVLHATDEVFDFRPRVLPSTHHYVGFLLWEAPAAPPMLLEEPGHPWVLVTASTSRPRDEELMLRSVLLALRSRDVRVLLTLPRDVADLPTTKNAVVERFVPHSPVLERSALCIGQGGHGIVSKCLTLGVPMVLLPWDADQPGVAARAEALGVAVVVPRSEATEESVDLAVAQALDDPRFSTSARGFADGVKERIDSRVAVGLVEQL